MFFSPLSKAYMEICKTQTREFFGLRDFYRYNYAYIAITGGILWENTKNYADQQVKACIYVYIA